MNARWQALAREAAAAAEHMAIGATALGRANYAQTAYYAQAFFSLSVGFERSGKLAFVVDHALDNAGAFPNAKALREFSHDLTAVLANMAEIGARRGVAATLPQSGIHRGIIEVLTDFATNVSRYYNLEVVSGSTHQKAQDPIAAWSRRVTEPILDAHYRPARRASDEERARLLDELVGPFAMIRHHAETGESIDSFYEGSRRTAATEFAKPWERVYVLQIARFIAEVLRELGFQAHQQGLQDVPYLSEFFAIFMNNDKYFRSRKNGRSTCDEAIEGSPTHELALPCTRAHRDATQSIPRSISRHRNLTLASSGRRRWLRMWRSWPTVRWLSSAIR